MCISNDKIKAAIIIDNWHNMYENHLFGLSLHKVEFAELDNRLQLMYEDVVYAAAA